ncbi:MAG: VOC family protein [Chloroflexi bacterium]|nr:MAG: VOC family protein [Chloroflexota bacterium]
MTGDEFRLPDGTHIGHVHLQVSDLERSLGFYEELLGFKRALETAHPPRLVETVALSATGEAPYHILLTERVQSRPKPARTTGLYHLAIRFPNRSALARVFARLAAHRYLLQGASDHKVSEAIYLADPDDVGIELYADRPSKEWPREGDQVAMATDPLDVQALLAEAALEDEPWHGIHPGTDIGHVHLHVSDLERAEAFYRGILGLEVTQRGYPGALFLSAGGYHHHVGLNIWAGRGAPRPPLDAVGMLSFGLRIPGEAPWRAVLARAEAAGLDFAARDTEQGTSTLLVDPDGNGVEVMLADERIEEALQA